MYTLDWYDKSGTLGQEGTSVETMNMICRSINDYSSKNNLGVNCTHLDKKSVNVDVIKKCVEELGCVLLRTYLDEDYYNKEKEIIIELNKPFKYNRKVLLDRFNLSKKIDFSLGEVSKRYCILFNKNK